MTAQYPYVLRMPRNVPLRRDSHGLIPQTPPPVPVAVSRASNRRPALPRPPRARRAHPAPAPHAVSGRGPPAARSALRPGGVAARRRWADGPAAHGGTPAGRWRWRTAGQTRRTPGREDERQSPRCRRAECRLAPVERGGGEGVLMRCVAMGTVQVVK